MEGEEEGIREGRESYENSSHLSPPGKKKKKKKCFPFTFILAKADGECALGGGRYQVC